MNRTDQQNDMAESLRTQHFNREEEDPSFKDYWYKILKRRWIVIISFLTIIFLTIFYTYSTTPIYRATAKLMIQKELTSVLTGDGGLPYSRYDQAFYNTQLEIIKSRPLAEQVISKLKLLQNPDFYTPPESGAKMESGGKMQVNPLSFRNIPQSAIVDFIDSVHVTPQKDSFIVLLSVIGKSPELITQIANALASSYISQQVENRAESTIGKEVWLRDELDKQKRQLEAAEIALQKYMESSGMISPVSAEREGIATQKLALLNSGLQTAELERSQIQRIHEDIINSKGDIEQILSNPGFMENENISSLQQSLIEIEREIAKLSVSLGHKHPTMVKLQGQKDSLLESRERIIKNITESYKKKYISALAKETELRKAIDGQKQEILNLKQKSIQYEVLRRDVETNRELYDVLLRQARETRVESTGVNRAVNIKIVESAVVPQLPVKPNKKINLILGLMIGLFVGIGLALLMDYFDNTLSNPEELKSSFKLPVLGPLPRLEASEAGADASVNNELYIYQKHTSAFGEAFRGIRTSLMFSAANPGCRVILVTSPAPREGKSLAAANLAVVMAQNGLRTLAIDADMRKPRMHKVFGIDRDRGLSNCLVTDEDPFSMIQPTEIANLSVMPSGPIPPNPSDLLGPPRISEILSLLREHYDCIIIDSPPVMPVSDPVLLSFHVDNVAIMVKARQTTRQMLGQALEKLRGTNPDVPVGAIINSMLISGRDYYYYNYYYYHYYAEDEGKVSRKKIKKLSKSGNIASLSSQTGSSAKKIRQKRRSPNSLRDKILLIITGLSIVAAGALGWTYYNSHKAAPVKKQPAPAAAHSAISGKNAPAKSISPAPPIDKNAANLTRRLESTEVKGKWNGQTLTLDISFDREIPGNPRIFTLGNPLRIVVDVAVFADGNIDKTFEVPENPIISQVRMGAHEDFTRFVLDVSKPFFPRYELTKIKKGLRITLGTSLT